jgi:hypothetical protein
MPGFENGATPDIREEVIKLGREYSPFAGNWVRGGQVLDGKVVGEWGFNVEGLSGKLFARVERVIVDSEDDLPAEISMGGTNLTRFDPIPEKSSVTLSFTTNLKTPQDYYLVSGYDAIVARFSFVDRIYWSRIGSDDWVDDDDYEFHDSEHALDRLQDGKEVETDGFEMHRARDSFQVVLPYDLKNPEEIKVSFIPIFNALLEMELSDQVPEEVNNLDLELDF